MIAPAGMRIVEAIRKLCLVGETLLEKGNTRSAGGKRKTNPWLVENRTRLKRDIY